MLRADRDISRTGQNGMCSKCISALQKTDFWSRQALSYSKKVKAWEV